MSYVNGLGLDVKGQRPEAQEHLHLEDFKFPDLKWAKSSRMSKRWIIFSLRVKVRWNGGSCEGMVCSFDWEAGAGNSRPHAGASLATSCPFAPTR
jgi:hypothetical protein